MAKRGKKSRKSPKAPKPDEKPRTIGRPSLLSPDLHAKFISLITQGNYIEIAANIVGISVATVYSWLSKGRAERAEERRTQCTDFLEAFEKALATSEAHAVQELFKLEKAGSFQAITYRLERRFPERWSKRSPHFENELERQKLDTDRIKLELEMMAAQLRRYEAQANAINAETAAESHDQVINVLMPPEANPDDLGMVSQNPQNPQNEAVDAELVDDAETTEEEGDE